MNEQRTELLADGSLRGSAWCRAHSDLVDRWLTELLEAACGPDPKGVALAAVGGYGRAELSPGSDIDVLLLHDRKVHVAPIADRIWYPIWDQGMQLGHRVTTVKEELKLASGDLDTATALLELRHVAGDAGLTSKLATEAGASWEKRSKRWLAELVDRVDERHARFGEVAFRLEPDLKEGRGGLRDVHALKWAEASHRVLAEHDQIALEKAYSVILDARVELQRLTGRPGNVLALQEQEAVAKALGDESADEMIARVAEAGRTIAWTSDDTFRRVRTILAERPAAGTVNWGTALGHGMVLRLSALEVTPDANLSDPLTVLRAARAAALNKAVIERRSLELLVHAQPRIPQPWPPEMRELLIGLLRTGANAIEVIEALDHRGLWSRLFPEWKPVRAKPQHNAYHLFTVDRHLLETVAQAAGLTERVDRPDLLMIVALLHDIGKGYPADHSLVGAQTIASIGARMGFDESDCRNLSEVVRLHLLLPDIATRRDLDDPGTLRAVADQVQTEQRLNLLWALTEADSLATGPSAWGNWKADLVGELVRRTALVIRGETADKVAPDTFPTEEQKRRLEHKQLGVETGEGRVTVYADDRPGTFSRTAGVLSLHGLDVLSAQAYSSENGIALAEFKVSDRRRDVIPWDKITKDLQLALGGGLALQARVAERARVYGRTKPMRRSPVPISVRFDNEVSDQATVVEVHAPDGIGVLYRITHALADLDLDIRSAKVQTMGDKVVDSFYLRDRRGNKITEKFHLGEIEKAVLHRLAEQLGI